MKTLGDMVLGQSRISIRGRGGGGLGSGLGLGLGMRPKKGQNQDQDRSNHFMVLEAGSVSGSVSRLASDETLMLLADEAHTDHLTKQSVSRQSWFYNLFYNEARSEVEASRGQRCSRCNTNFKLVGINDLTEENLIEVSEG